MHEGHLRQATEAMEHRWGVPVLLCVMQLMKHDERSYQQQPPLQQWPPNMLDP